MFPSRESSARHLMTIRLDRRMIEVRRLKLVAEAKNPPVREGLIIGGRWLAVESRKLPVRREVPPGGRGKGEFDE